MIKSLLISALLIFLFNGTKTLTGDNNILLPEGDETTTEVTDSTDALTVFSAKIKDKTVYVNWRVLNPKSISYYEVYRLLRPTQTRVQ